MLTVKAMAEVVAWSLMATQMDDLGVPHFRKPPYGSRYFYGGISWDPGHIYHLRYQWIGLRENFNRKAPYLMGKSMVSG